MRNFLVILNANVVDLVIKEGEFVSSDTTEEYDTIVDDASKSYAIGNTYNIDDYIDRISTLDDFKNRVLSKIKADYDQVCNGKDPIAHGSIYVDCTVNSTTYRMNAGIEAAINMDSGVRIFERSGAAQMSVVRDFNNVNHIDVSIADAVSISLQQGIDALGYWQQKGIMVDAVNAASTKAELDAINTVFTVNSI